MLKVISVRISPDSNINAFKKILSPSELKKADNFRFSIHRNQFIIARGVLKQRLSEMFSLPLQELNFSYSESGKPFLPDTPIYFNLSHSEECVLIAFSDEGSLGIDIERINSAVEVKKIAHRFFSADEEKTMLEMSSEQKVVEAFYETWTRKEAFIKAHGDGLQIPLHQFKVDISQDYANLKYLEYKSDYAGDWWIRNLEIEKDYKAALCTSFPKDDNIEIEQLDLS